MTVWSSPAITAWISPTLLLRIFCWQLYYICLYCNLIMSIKAASRALAPWCMQTWVCCSRGISCIRVDVLHPGFWLTAAQTSSLSIPVRIIWHSGTTNHVSLMERTINNCVYCQMLFFFCLPVVIQLWHLDVSNLRFLSKMFSLS